MPLPEFAGKRATLQRSTVTCDLRRMGRSFTVRNVDPQSIDCARLCHRTRLLLRRSELAGHPKS